MGWQNFNDTLRVESEADFDSYCLVACLFHCAAGSGLLSIAIVYFASMLGF
jgi:hypothetical protein